MKKEGVDAVAMDLHPGYETRKVAQRFAEEFSVPCLEVQHHWAHAASLLLDNTLDKCVVLTLDGLGYGDDGTLWGGEVLVSSFDSYERVGRLEYIPLLGGDQAARDPRRLVFAIFKHFNREKYFTGNEASILNKMMDKAPQSSSFGRVLDALACYLDICTQRTYDGEPSMKLERYLAVGKGTYSFDVEVKNNVVGTIDLFRQLEEKVRHPLSEKQKANCAYSLVKTIVDGLVDIAVDGAEQEKSKTVGITGGVSYNIPIVEMVKKRVTHAGLSLCVHNRIPNGDGGIALGQNVIVGHKVSF